MPLKNPEVWPDLFRPATGQKLYMCKIFIRFLEKIPSPYAPETIWRAAIRTPRGLGLHCHP